MLPKMGPLSLSGLGLSSAVSSVVPCVSSEPQGMVNRFWGVTNDSLRDSVLVLGRLAPGRGH